MGREISLGDAMERARLAFYPRSQDGAYETGTSHWYARASERSVTVVAAGSIEGELPAPGITFTTASLRREGWTWTGGGDFHTDGKGGLARVSAPVTEWLRGTRAGVEQGWTVEHEPPGSGPLTVRLEVDGTDSASAHAGGLRFESPGGPVIYGHATWIDADGRRSSIEARWEDGYISLSVPEDVVSTAAYPVVLDPVIGPETQTDPYVWGPNNHPASAPRGGCTTTACVGFYTNGSAWWQMRFGLDGALLDTLPAPTALFSGPYAPVFATAGDRIAVVSGNLNGLYFRFLDANGSVLSGPVALPISAPDPALVQVSCSTSQCLAVWKDLGIAEGMRIATDGTVLDPFGFPIASFPPFSDSPIDVDRVGATYLVSHGSKVTRVTDDGTVLDAVGIDIGFPVSSIASDGSTWVVAGTYYHRTVISDGTLGPTISEGLSTTLTWMGSSYIAASGTDYYLYDGTPTLVAGPTPFTPSGSGTGIAPVPGGGAFLMSYGTTGSTIRKVDVTGSLASAPVALNNGANRQHFPFVVAGDDQYLLAWLDSRLATNAVYAQRLDSTGTPIDSLPFLLTTVALGDSPYIGGAFNGTSYMLSLRKTNGSQEPLWAYRVSPAGQVLDPQGIDLGLLGNETSVASNGSDFLVTGGFFGQRVTSAGTVFGPPIFVDLQVRGRSAFDGTAYVVSGYEAGQLRALQVMTNGVVPGPPLDLAPVMNFPIEPTGLACVGATCLVTSSVGFAALPPSGVPLVSPPPLEPRVTAAGAGAEFVVVALSPSVGGADVVGARFSVTDPPVQIGSWFPITQTAQQPEDSPTVATLDGVSAVVAYSRFEPSVDASRIYIRTLQLASPQGTACLANSDCQSGFCVDGFCCDQACGGNGPSCQVCAAALGATADGVCTLRSAGSVCRPPVGSCDFEEVCDGNAPTCPNDVVLDAGEICRASAGDCDLEESCNGTDGACPEDEKNVGFTCRPASDACDADEICGLLGDTCPEDEVRAENVTCRNEMGDCDVREVCDGISKSCPADDFEPAGTSCRAAIGECDADETCTGSAADCPADASKPEGTACGAPSSEACFANICTGSEGATAQCLEQALPDGTSCGEGSACEAGVCSELETEESTSSTSSGGDVDGGDGEADEEGCSCRTASTPSGSSMGLTALLIAALLRRRRFGRAA